LGGFVETAEFWIDRLNGSVPEVAKQETDQDAASPDSVFSFRIYPHWLKQQYDHVNRSRFEKRINRSKRSGFNRFRRSFGSVWRQTLVEAARYETYDQQDHEHLGLSRTLPAGAFGLSEDTGTVYYQYALHLPTRAAEKEVLASVVLSLDTFIGGYLGEIRAVAKGESTLQAAFERIRTNGFEIPPMLPGPASILGGGDAERR
jgi:hypothetical protein